MENDLIEKEKIVLVSPIKTTNFSKMRATLDEVYVLSEKKSISNVLVDCRELTELPDAKTLYEFASSFPKHLKFAFVMPDARKTKKPEEMEKTLNVQVGLETLAGVGAHKKIRTKVFTDYGSAKAWLRESA